MRDPKHPQQFQKSFKRQIVKLYDSGQAVRELSKEHDIAPSCIYRWIKIFHDTPHLPNPSQNQNQNRNQNQIQDQFQGDPSNIEDLLEYYKIQNEKLQMEVDILKQAALIHAQKCAS